MKKHTGAYAVLASTVLSLCAAGFGFSRWSSDLNLGGTISARAAWDLHIEEASIRSVSAGASTDADERVTPAVYEVTVYDIYADYCTDFNVDWQEYRLQIDDLNPRTVSLSLDELLEYTYNCAIPGRIMAGYNNYTSGIKGTNAHYRMNLNETAAELGFEEDRIYAENPDGSSDGAYLGTAICSYIVDEQDNAFGLMAEYQPALDYLSSASAVVDYPASISEDGHSAQFGNVNLGLPSAWAEYAVTVINNGTAGARVNAQDIHLETESELLILDVPVLDDTMLRPGDACTFTFVVSVEDTDRPVLDETGTVWVSLHHEQETVEPAPQPAHEH